MIPKVPMIEMGTATLGMIVADRLRRNKNMTITTRAIVRISVNSTSATEARMVAVRSVSVVISIADGNEALSWGSKRLMRSTTAMMLAPGRLLTAAGRRQADTGELRDLLGQVGVGEVLHLGERQRIRGQRERQNRRVRGIDLAVDGRAGQITRQEGRRGIDRGLDLLLGDVDRVVEGELQRDQRGAERARRGHL